VAVVVEEARRLQAELQARLRRWYHDPVAFARDVFGVRLWHRQRQIVRSAARSSAHGGTFRIAVRSGHKCGKSMILAVLALWWGTTRPAARVIMTAPSGRQIRSILWREVRKLYDLARKRLAAIGGLGGRLYEVPDAGLQYADQSEVVGFSTNQPERMAGTSGENLLYLIDEASGVDLKIWEAIEGNRAGDASVVMFSNPTQTSGYFFDAFHANASLWQRFHISSEETPNVKSGTKTVPGLATRAWVEEKRVEWGPDYAKDPRYQVRVQGVFPRHAANQVITLEEVREAKRRFYAYAAQLLGREMPVDPELWPRIFRPGLEMAQVQARFRASAQGILRIGVDPAWLGDDLTVIFLRRGDRMFEPVYLQGQDGLAIANRVETEILRYRRAGERPRVLIDVIGIGADAYGHLARKAGIVTVPVNSSRAAEDDEEYRNLRSELHFGAKKWLRAGGSFAPHPILETELTAARYTIDGVGRIAVEAKPDIKKRLGRSPDYADAFALATYEGSFVRRVLSPTPTKTGLRFSQSPGRGYG
jgi:hypothetical protein